MALFHGGNVKESTDRSSISSDDSWDEDSQGECKLRILHIDPTVFLINFNY